MSERMTPTPGSFDYEYQISHYDQDERPKHYAAIIICTIAPTLAVILRLYAQRVYVKRLGLDDLFVVLALVILYAQVIASLLCLKAGTGLHQVRVIREDTNQPNGLVLIYTSWWIISVLWAPAITFIKLSILMLYGRIFYVSQKWLKIALWFNALYAVALGVASTLILFFQCWPINFYWKRALGFYDFTLIPEGFCSEDLARTIAPQVLSTASDLVILFLPVPIIWRLYIKPTRKYGLLLVFLLGAFTVGCGIARLSAILHVDAGIDSTWNDINLVTFTVVEAGVGIICACMPPSTPLYNSLMRRWGLMSAPEVTTDKSNGYGSSRKLTVFTPECHQHSATPSTENVDIEYMGLVSGDKGHISSSHSVISDIGSKVAAQPHWDV